MSLSYWSKRFHSMLWSITSHYAELSVITLREDESFIGRPDCDLWLTPNKGGKMSPNNGRQKLNPINSMQSYALCSNYCVYYCLTTPYRINGRFTRWKFTIMSRMFISQVWIYIDCAMTRIEYIIWQWAWLKNKISSF